MKTILKESVWVTLTLSLFCIVFVAISFTYAPKERLIPLSVGLSGLVLSILMLFGERFPELIRKFDVSADNLIQKDAANTAPTSPGGRQTPIRKTLQIYGWTIGFLALICLIGFLIATPVFMLAFLKIYGRISWSRATAVSVITWLLIYGLFDMLLKAELFQGILFGAYVSPL